MLRIHDSARRQVVPFEPAEPGRVSMYVCGPTVYGPPHLGHGRFSLVFDVLRRYLEWSGFEVTYVSNITDVDDNIINRANEEGRSTGEVVREYETLWYDAMDAIGVKRPTHDPHASAYIDEMIGFTEELVARGVAYETDDGVYFSPADVSDYGLLSGQALDTLLAGARVEVDEQKRSPIDFALWKKAKPGEPDWPSPWGPGRPGWHTECVVMSTGLLGDTFDIHGGGQDLRFPHHENERAQAAAVDKPFARYWMHNGFVEVGGEKMSKSLGNFTNLTDLIETTDPRAYRLLVLRSHYRSPLEVNRETTSDASQALHRLDAVARRTRPLQEVQEAHPDADALAEFRSRMDDDLDTPGAVALLFDLVREVNAGLDAGEVAAVAPAAAAIWEIARAVGLELRVDEDDVPDSIDELARERDAARAARDYARADAIRDELQTEGWVVEDTAEGTRVRRA